jgi:hypothetical protein
VRQSAVRLLASTALVVATAAAAHAAPITGGTTEVTLTSAATLASLGASVSGLGTATINTSGTYPVATFPITGGSTSPSGNLIEHNGSGLAITAGSTVVDARNFLIDTANAVIDSDVSINSGSSSNIGLFAIGSGLSLTLTSGAATALSPVFGLPASQLEALVIGTATTSPTVGTGAVDAPEPATVAMLGAGLLGLVAFRRRTHAAC